MLSPGARKTRGAPGGAIGGRIVSTAARELVVQRCEHLNQVATLLASFETVEDTFDAALAVAARTLPLESAILIQDEANERKMILWSPAGSSVAVAARKNAENVFSWLVGAGVEAQVRTEHAGRTSLPRAPVAVPGSPANQRFIVLPLVVANRPVFGALQMEAAEFDRLDLVFVSAMANQFAVALDRDRAWRRDIARRDHAEVTERKLRAQAEEMAAADHQRSELLSVLADELRVSLVAFREIQVLMRAAAGGNVIDRAIGTMSGQIQQMAQMIDELHGLSSLTREQAEVQRNRVDVCGLLAEAVEQNSDRLSARGQTLTVNMCEPAWVEADRARIAQVFDTLIDKASLLASPGGRIWLTARTAEGPDVEATLGGVPQVVVTLRDDGAGAVRAVLPRMIDLLNLSGREVDPDDARFSSGLKLTRRIVELHGGRVCATTSGLGQGSEFEVRLPLGDQKAEFLGPERRSS